MPISWNEIRGRALAFSKDFGPERRENAEAQTFWNDFFKVFGLTRRHLASFEEPVKNIRGHYSFIDLFWKAILIAEHKRRGESLEKAHVQAMEYIQDLTREGRAEEVPQYVIVSDFARIALHDLVDGTSIEFPLAEFHLHLSHFGFIAGYRKHRIEPADPINIKAVEIMGDLHDALEEGGYSGHELERLLVRILFCLFADYTGIFERLGFKLFIENHTAPDGSDLGPQLARLFQVLNTPPERRQKNLLEELAALPYVNGDLYAESLSFAEFNSDMRNRLLACTKFDWSRISPAIFGALFQSVMEGPERRQIGAHYTSERDILKVLGPLFLDDLKSELAKAGNETQRLKALHNRLAQMRLLDPACGCGNFLVVSYRELRLLELEIVRRLYRNELRRRTENEPAQRRLDIINTLFRLDVHQFYGIEIEEWPVRIAEVAMWLMDHQMNLRVSEEFGEYFVRLPLRSSPHIHHGNALRINWDDVLSADNCTHVLGNPPFVGKHLMSESQERDVSIVCRGIEGSGVLDYVSCWYLKAIEYVAGRPVPIAFVSTNSITQGEQVGVLWISLFRKGAKIHFAHRTFEWTSEARGKAHVHVVIIGWGVKDRAGKKIFDYEHGNENPTVIDVSNISPYLVEGPDIALPSRTSPLCDVPACNYGSKPADGGNLIVEDHDLTEFLAECPDARQYIRPLLCTEEYLYSIPRWCLWLVGAKPSELRKMKNVWKRLELAREFRLKSKKPATRKLANTPYLFAEIRQPTVPFMVVPQHTSETRRYVPFGYFTPDHIVHNSCSAIPGATNFHFGVLSSSMHMAWVRQVCGRIKSDYRYSTKLVYNNFPWPQGVDDSKRQAVEEGAQGVLDARRAHRDSSLADLYGPLSMPANLVKAHTKLDRAVDRCYRSQPFPNERNRVEYLFKLYQELIAPLLPAPRTRRKKSS